MDIGKSFSYVFEDKKWIEKILIGGLVSLIPFVGIFLVAGYVIELVRNVRRHESTPLPEWDRWGDKLADGFKIFIIMLVWSIPLIILAFIGFVPLIAAGNSDSGGFLSFLALCFSCFFFLYTIVLFFASPGITINYAESGDIAAGFQVSKILDFAKSHIGDIIIYVIVVWLVGILANIIGALLCGLGLLFTSFWAMLVGGHLLAQIGLEPAPAMPKAAPESIAEPEPTPELPEPPAPSEPTSSDEE